MIRTRVLWSALAATSLLASAAVAQPGKDKPKDAPKPPAAPTAPADAAGQPGNDEMAKMMEIYMKAATPGKMHEHLAKGVGTWEGVVKHWPAPDAPVMESPCTTVVSSMFDGRYYKADVTGEMAEMGKFQGFGIYAYDNVSEKFQNMWIDSMGTGIMTGTGVLSADGKSLTWTMTCFDPMTKKPMVMRQVDRHINENSSVMEMYGPGPDGKEFKMMEINYTRKGPGKSPDHSSAAEKSKAADHKPADAGKPAKK